MLSSSYKDELRDLLLCLEAEPTKDEAEAPPPPPPSRALVASPPPPPPPRALADYNFDEFVPPPARRAKLDAIAPRCVSCDRLMCICGGAAIAVKGNLKLDPWLMVREVGALFIALVLFVIVMQDSMVQATDARKIRAQFGRRNSGAIGCDAIL